MIIATVSGPLGEHRLLELLEQRARQLGALQRGAVGARVRDVAGRDRGRSERLAERLEAGERERSQRHAVVGGAASDRLAPLGLAVGEVVVAHELPSRLDRLRAAAGEEDALEAVGRDARDTLRQLDRRRVRGRPVGVERQLDQLLARGLRHLGAVGVAELAAEQAREPVDVAPPRVSQTWQPSARSSTSSSPAPGPERAVAGEVQQQMVVCGPLQAVVGQLHRDVTTFLRV